MTGEVCREVNVAVKGNQVFFRSDLLLRLASEAETTVKGEVAHILYLNVENRSSDLQSRVRSLG